jgi:hypothetical protein
MSFQLISIVIINTEIEGTQKLQLADGRRWRTESQLLGSFNSDVLTRSG